jgi:transposase
MGERTVMQEALFYSFSLEQHVPADHLLRSIGRFIDLSDIREHLRPYYSETGRPSIDPELLITTVARCMAEGSIGSDSFAVDASMIKRQYDQGRRQPSALRAGQRWPARRGSRPYRAGVSRSAG